MEIAVTVGLDVIHCSMNFHTYNRWIDVVRIVTVQTLTLFQKYTMDSYK